MKKPERVLLVLFGVLVLITIVVTRVERPTPTTVTTTVPTTTTASTTTTVVAAGTPDITIDDVIMFTRAQSLTYDDITWADMTDDEGLSNLAVAICGMYHASGDQKNATVALSMNAYFDGYGSHTPNDLELWSYFAGGVIDLLCGEED